MTAEALSPPSPMQSLRERLIQQGSIVPRTGVEKLIDQLNKKIIQIIDADSATHDEIRKSYLDYAMSVLIRRSIHSLSEYESKSSDENNTYIWALKFSLLINKFNRFINFSFQNLRANDQSTQVARCGFYSPLKENMKNTP